MGEQPVKHGDVAIQIESTAPSSVRPTFSVQAPDLKWKSGDAIPKRGFTKNLYLTPPTILAMVVLGPLLAIAASLPIYGMSFILVSLVAILIVPVCIILVYFQMWWADSPPFNQYAGWFMQIMYVRALTPWQPLANPSGLKRTPNSQEIMAVTAAQMVPSKLKPKGVLKKLKMQYGLNLQVPSGTESQYHPNSPLVEWAINNLFSHFPVIDYMQHFKPGENCVEWLMQRIHDVYPAIWDVWEDKHSDQAFARFCCNGLGAHRLETVLEGAPDDTKQYSAKDIANLTGEPEQHPPKVKYFVVRCNALAALPVRDGFARYGGDAFFDSNWKCVKIVFADVYNGDFRNNGLGALKTVRPSDGQAWERAKVRFRGSLFALVTVVDHLYGIHLQIANLLVTASREQLSASHPLRRFLTPFSFDTIQVNAHAYAVLVKNRTFAMRTFALTTQSFSIAMSSGTSLLWANRLPSIKSEPIKMVHIDSVIKSMKKDYGIDSEYNRQTHELWKINHKFVVDYLSCYYGKGNDEDNGSQTSIDVEIEQMADALYADEELRAFVAQFQLSFTAVSTANSMSVLKKFADDTKKGRLAFANFLVEAVASFVLAVTQYHTQMGSIQVYTQDVSWVPAKFEPDGEGTLCGTKATAMAQGLLMSATSPDKPLLMQPVTQTNPLYKHDPIAPVEGVHEQEFYAKDSAERVWAPWTQLFELVGSKKNRNGQTPVEAFWEYQRDLQVFSTKVDKYNSKRELAKREFPQNFPVYSCNPRYMDCSVSV